MINMESTVAHAFHRFALAILGLALPVALVAYGGNGDSRGLVRKIQPSGSVARYESRVGDNHHHIVCRSCGVIADVDCAVGEAPCLTASDHNGFLLDEAEVIYWGLCPDCSISDTSRSHP